SQRFDNFACFAHFFSAAYKHLYLYKTVSAGRQRRLRKPAWVYLQTVSGKWRDKIPVDKNNGLGQ
ncbi:MAG: hypothetical protein ACK5QC_15290, partial [Bacteroidota bacterium]